MNGETEMGTFYRLRSSGNDKIYSEEEFLTNIQETQDFLFVKENEESSQVRASLDDIKGLIGLLNPSLDIADKDIPNYFVSPQVKAEALVTKFYDAEGNQYDLTSLNQLLYSHYNLLEKYNNGKCIFIVPIVHNNTATNTLYGLVRNHSYTLTVKSISGFGRGIASDDSIISDEELPEMKSTYTVNAKLIINDWSEIGQYINIEEKK